MTIGVLDRTNSILDDTLDAYTQSISSQEADINSFFPRRRFADFSRKILSEFLLHPSAHLVGATGYAKGLAILLEFKMIAVSMNTWWQKPLVNVDEHTQEIVLEWWHQGKKITIYVEGEKAEYIKVWGPDMDSEMEEGQLNDPQDMLNLWLWIAF
jgi:hypothetical protein